MRCTDACERGPGIAAASCSAAAHLYNTHLVAAGFLHDVVSCSREMRKNQSYWYLYSAHQSGAITWVTTSFGFLQPAAGES